MMWLVLLGMFLITAFVTWGFFANIEDARQTRDNEEREALLAALGAGELSARLTDELRTIAEAGEDAEQWLRRTRVRHGHCLLTSADDCDNLGKCVLCEHFETTASDLPALESLLEQKLEHAARADGRGHAREAQLYRADAERIAGHIRYFASRIEGSLA